MEEILMVWKKVAKSTSRMIFPLHFDLFAAFGDLIILKTFTIQKNETTLIDQE